MGTGSNGHDSKDRRYVLEADVEQSKLHYRHRHILLTLLRHADTKTGYIPDQYSPSIKRLEQWTGIRHATLLSDLNRLEEMGWLIRERSKKHGRGHRTLYRVTPPQSAPAQASVTERPADTMPAPARENGPQTQREAAARMIKEHRPDVDDAAIYRALDQLDGPHVRTITGLVNKLIDNGHIDQYLNGHTQHQASTPAPPNFKDLCSRCGKAGHAKGECEI